MRPVRLLLTPHPTTTRAAVSGIEVEVSRSVGGLLTLAYQVTGEIAGLRLPAPAAPHRTDELWKHSCFEAFIRPAAGEAYVEFNAAPSTQWAAYGFERTRAGMRNADIPPPRLETHATTDRFDLRAALDLRSLGAGPWRLNLSAVIEETGGPKSYWALAHPSAQPDFHHPDAFVLDLAEPA